MSPEPYDPAVVQDLVLNAHALITESEGDDGFLQRLLLDVELAGDREAEERTRELVQKKADYYREASRLWDWAASGIERKDMTTVRGAFAGLRSRALEELQG